jgi:hypothetical protein
MTRTRLVWGSGRRGPSLLMTALLFLLLWAMPASGKVSTEFDPNLDFSKFKTFAYIGGVEKLATLQLNPDQLGNRIHRSVSAELVAKGLREVKPEENPDLVVRYWANSQINANVATSANWGVYGPYFGYHWGFMYYSMDATTTRKGTLAIELIDTKSRDLGWRLFASAKLIHNNPDKIWKQVDSEIRDAFKGFPPSPKAIADQKAEWAKQDAAKTSSQP